MADFIMAFDQHSLKEIAQFAGFPILLSPEMQVAMGQGGGIIVQAAQANADERFANPTGQLRDAIVPLLNSPYELQIQVQVPYGRRRDLGFSGADSLGRVYNDPPFAYLTDATTDTSQQVLQGFDDALNRAVSRIGGA